LFCLLLFSIRDHDADDDDDYVKEETFCIYHNPYKRKNHMAGKYKIQLIKITLYSMQSSEIFTISTSSRF
jgi:hypothetical protein